MRMYFEMLELLSEEEAFTRQPQQIRIEIASEDEAQKYLQQFEPLFEGKKYVAQIHYCYHEEGKPCEVKVIKRVE